MKAVARAWAWSRDLAFVLWPCRFSLVVVVFGGALLLAVPQGREMTVRLADDHGHVAWFCAGVAAWAFQTWYWARFMLDSLFGPDRQPAPGTLRRPRRTEALVNQVPRVIALGSYGVAIVACFTSGEARNGFVAAILGMLGIAFYVGLVKRRDLTGWIAQRLGGTLGHWVLPAPGHGGRRVFSDLAPLSKLVFWVSLAVAAGWLAWACIDPVGMGWQVGAAAVPFIGFSSMVPVGSLAVWAARSGGVRHLPEEEDRVNDPRVGYPVILALAACALVFSLWVDNHRVRELPGAAAHRAMPAAQAVDAWRQAQGSAPGPLPLVIVATAGGGIRAAYWTGTVLGALQDCAPAFRQRLMAISGVSGGSLGATVFASLAAGDAAAPAGGCAEALKSPQPWPRGATETAAQRILSHDFFAPAVAGLLFPDLLQRFVPVSLLPDRAQALERGWERAWAATGLDPEAWATRSFDDLWAAPGGRWQPALLLNGTVVETGQRIVTSNLAIEPAIFRDTIDFFQAYGHRAIRPSTAAHNSARFTYVSPAGGVAKDLHVVDGGYFENFGARTAAELLDFALLRLGPGAVRPIVVLISNDPALPQARMPAEVGGAECAGCRKASAKGPPLAGEVLSPLAAMLATRDAHGIGATFDLLQSSLAAQGGRFFHFRLCDAPPAPEPALGWVLSRASEDTMQRMLRQPGLCGNAEQFRALVALLATP